MLRYPGTDPEFRAAPEGHGRPIVAAHKDELGKRRALAHVGGLVLTLLLAAMLSLLVPLVVAIVAAGAVYAIALILRAEPPLPELAEESEPLTQAKQRYDAVDYATDADDNV